MTLPRSPPAVPPREEAPVAAEAGLCGTAEHRPLSDYSFLAPAGAADELGRLAHYRVLELLGQGGMGLVFRAGEAGHGRQVALKVLRPELAAEAAFRRRFVREARTTAGLEHERIVPILHVGQEGDAPFFVMPLLRGASLAVLTSRRGRLPVGEVPRVGREVAEGLAYAHGRGVVHRDVKPANVWLGEGSGRVTLLDFGLAYRGPGTGSDPGLTRVIGTPSYMAPEQGRDDDVDGRAGLFSLGCVLYLLCTGRPAFRESRDVVATLRRVAESEPEPPAAVRPGLPPALSALVLLLLTKDRAGRPSSAGAVAAALRAIKPH